MKFRINSPIGATLGLIAAVAYACSSDGDSQGNGPGAGGTAGSGGSSAENGGSVSDAGENVGGAAGEPAMPKAGEACLSCLATGTNGATDSGCAALSDCEDSTLCAPWLACVRACNTDACVETCDGDHEQVAPYRYAVYDCLCNSCESACSPIAVCDRGCVEDVDLPPLMAPPATLAETGLYVGLAGNDDPTNAGPWQLAPYAREFAPEYALWSDGASKRRWAYIPSCGRIDTSDMDHWEFPVGTRFWKQFTIGDDNTSGTFGGTRVETRLIHRFGPGPDYWIFAAYQWPASIGMSTTEDPTLALHVPDGVPDANGTMHDIPAETACLNCHTKLTERILSFSAIQLSHSNPGVTIKQLSDEGWLTVPAPAGFDPPGNAVAQAALGYLHANCGNCHNDSFAPVEPSPLMRLLVTDETVAMTGTVTSLVNIPTVNMDFAQYDRIEPGFPDDSEIIIRMGIRLPETGQMPPVATELEHTEGIQIVSDWITAIRDGV
jgi:hypothetical protein